MKKYYGILKRLDGKVITIRTNSSEKIGYWTSNPMDFVTTNKSPMRMFVYDDEQNKCESPGVSMEINAMERIDNIYHFVDYLNVPYEFVLTNIVDD
jgi:hypothetical protein